MLIILPPSETKAHGGTGAPLAWESLSFPELNPIRSSIATELAALDVDEALQVLGISEALRPEAESNTQFFTSPTMPALDRFTGVLYDALDAASLDTAARSRLAVGDALFGLASADDMIPHYRLSGGTKLGGRTLKSRWGKAITESLAALADAGQLIVDLRSGTYQQLGRFKPAVTVRVESVRPDGTRTVVSHFNKHYKGELARALAQAPADAASLNEVLDLARAAGFTVEPPAPGINQITMVVDPGATA